MSLIAMPYIGEIIKTDDIVSIKVFGSLIYELEKIQLPSTGDEWPFITVKTNLKLSFIAKIKDSDKEGNEIHTKRKFMEDYFNLGNESMAIFNSPWFEEERAFVEKNKYKASKDKASKAKSKKRLIKNIQKRYNRLTRIIKSAEKFNNYLNRKQQNLNKSIENREENSTEESSLESFFSRNEIANENGEELATDLHNSIELFAQEKINGIKRIEVKDEKKEEVPIDELLDWANHNMKKEIKDELVKQIENSINNFVLNK